MPVNLSEIQDAIATSQIDGWLFFDFKGSNKIAYDILQLDINGMYTRRWYYWIPKTGSPIKICQALEPHILDQLPGKTVLYYDWKSLTEVLSKIFEFHPTVAMEYSPMGGIPYVSNVDGGTIELMRDLGANLVSSASLIQIFQCRLTLEQVESHLNAAQYISSTIQEAFSFIWDHLQNNESITEYDVQQFILTLHKKNGYLLIPPIVAVNENSADPHYIPPKIGSKKIKVGDLVLIDTFTKSEKKKSIFGDLTRIGYAGSTIPEEMETVFNIVAAARDAAVNLVAERFAANTPVCGWEVDDACRQVIIDANLGNYFIHRTGHNIHENAHGNGANIDNFETHDDRPIIAGTCFSIEPGVYFPDKWGIRSEINVYVSDQGQVFLSDNPIQKRIVPILEE